jgi:hypothetical protein
MNDPENARLAARLWAEQDPDGFWNWLKQSRDGTLLKQFGKDLLQVWATADPDVAMQAANAITDKECSDFLRREVIDTVIAKDLKKGLELAAAAPDFNRFSWGPREWMKTDPAAAVQGLAGLPERSEYRDFLKYAVVAWAKDSPALLAWLGTQSMAERDEWFGAAFKSAAAVNLQAALEAASKIADPSSRDAAVAGVLASGKIPTDSLPDLLSQLTLPNRSAATLAALDALPLKDPRQLSEATKLLIEAPANRNTLNSVDRIARSFKDLDEGLAWTALLPEATMRRRALISLTYLADSAQGDQLASMVSTRSSLDLSNDLFRTILTRMSAEQKAAWLAKLSRDRAAWAEAAAASQNK